MDHIWGHLWTIGNSYMESYMKLDMGYIWSDIWKISGPYMESYTDYIWAMYRLIYGSIYKFKFWQKIRLKCKILNDVQLRRQ